MGFFRKFKIGIWKLSEEEIRARRKQKRTRNMYAKELREAMNGLKGPFSLKVIEPKNEYKRVKLSPRHIKEDEEFE